MPKYLTDDVLQFTRQWRGLVIAVKGASTTGKPSKVDFTWRGAVIKAGAELWIVGHDTAKAQLFARLAGDRKCLAQDRLVQFPHGLSDDFYGQLTAEIYDSTKRRWVKIRPRNEALDCFTYAVAAAMHPALRIHTWHEPHWQKWEARIGLSNDLFSAPQVKENPAPLTNHAPEVKPSPVSLPSPQPAAAMPREAVTRRIRV